jgi:hypothetical protein
MADVRIAEDLLPLVRPLAEFQHHPKNPRRGKIVEIAEALERFGQKKPLIAQATTGYIVVGNQRMAAMERLGWNAAAISVVDMTDDQALGLLLVDNRSSDLGEYDDSAVLDLLEQIDSYVGTGYTPDAVDDLIARVEGAKVLPTEPFHGDYAEPDDEYEARRAEAEARGSKMREVVLLMTEGSHAAFQAAVARLRSEYGTDTVAATVVEAVKRERAAA